LPEGWFGKEDTAKEMQRKDGAGEDSATHGVIPNGGAELISGNHTPRTAKGGGICVGTIATAPRRNPTSNVGGQSDPPSDGDVRTRITHTSTHRGFLTLLWEDKYT
jgi:hypothetical protein